MPGTLVGIDRHGNRYYEDKTQFFGQDRRVDYNYDEPNASQVSSQWYGWLHHCT
jgi:NADH:ubiquinone oxidoreductase subunit